tara:strand:- start:89 stop:352 length:264 start_codon:yes stop_codon:yes gene_type:complete
MGGSTSTAMSIKGKEGEKEAKEIYRKIDALEEDIRSDLNAIIDDVAQTIAVRDVMRCDVRVLLMCLKDYFSIMLVVFFHVERCTRKS